MGDVFPFKSGGGGGPENPTLEQRVAHLEDDMKDVKSSLTRIEQRLASIDAELKHVAKASEVAELRGRLSNLPTTIQMIMMLITIWSVGTGMILAVLRFAPK